jgi:hypothetical protein
LLLLFRLAGRRRGGGRWFGHPGRSSSRRSLFSNRDGAVVMARNATGGHFERGLADFFWCVSFSSKSTSNITNVDVQYSFCRFGTRRAASIGRRSCPWGGVCDDRRLVVERKQKMSLGHVVCHAVFASVMPVAARTE